MNSNYNDIIDIILTLIDDEDISNNIAISGSIVPYLVTNKESLEYHSDFYILVKSKKIDLVRDKVRKLTKEYEFDFVSDSKKYSKEDYGFKIKYQGTTVGFFPYSLIDNDLTIKTYSLNKEKDKIDFKKKIIPRVTKSSVIRLINFGKDKKIRIMTPEFILADKETREKGPGNPTKETMYLLNKITDESVLKVVRESVINTKVKIVTKETKDNNYILIIILGALVVLLLVVAYICFKK